jgi:hypothetical protein
MEIEEEIFDNTIGENLKVNFNTLAKDIQDGTETILDVNEIFTVEAGQYFRKGNFIFRRQVVSFNSRTLKENERNYGISKLEGLALTWGITINHNLLYGRHFTAYTDHKSFVSLNSRDPTNLSLFNNITSWMQTLSKYSFDLVYIQGDKNVIPDFLSRKDLKEAPKFMKHEFPDSVEMTIDLEDAFANLDIVTEESEQKQLLEKYHENFGHFGARHIVKLIHEKEKKHWKNIYPMAISHCRSCPKCAAFTVQTQGYHPLRMSDAIHPYDVICCDVAHMTSIEGEHAYNYTLITVDLCTRFVCLEPLQSLAAEEVALLSAKFSQEWVFQKAFLLTMEMSLQIRNSRKS